MKVKYLIFPMVLTDCDFSSLIERTVLLKAMNFNKLSSINQCRQNIIYHLACAIIDIQEVITNKNSKGYRYNSYILNMSALKLTFVNELIESKALPYLKEEHELISECISIIENILSAAYQEQIYPVKEN